MYQKIRFIIFQKRGFKINPKKSDVFNIIPNPGAHFMGHFKNGQAVGTFWLGLSNNGFLHGSISEEGDGHISGNNMTFIYPDGVTSLHGTFEKSIMKR